MGICSSITSFFFIAVYVKVHFSVYDKCRIYSLYFTSDNVIPFAVLDGKNFGLEEKLRMRSEMNIAIC